MDNTEKYRLDEITKNFVLWFKKLRGTEKDIACSLLIANHTEDSLRMIQDKTTIVATIKKSALMKALR